MVKTVDNGMEGVVFIKDKFMYTLKLYIKNTLKSKRVIKYLWDIFMYTPKLFIQRQTHMCKMRVYFWMYNLGVCT